MWLCDTEKRIPGFDSCQLTILWMSYVKSVPMVGCFSLSFQSVGISSDSHITQKKMISWSLVQKPNFFSMDRLSSFLRYGAARARPRRAEVSLEQPQVLKKPRNFKCGCRVKTSANDSVLGHW